MGNTQKDNIYIPNESQSLPVLQKTSLIPRIAQVRHPQTPLEDIWRVLRTDAWSSVTCCTPSRSVGSRQQVDYQLVIIHTATSQ
jgi:hypothetical protein